MPERIQKQKPAPQKKTEEQVEPKKSETDIVELTDELLDDIDALLEEIGVETVLEYRQKGGQ